MNRVLPFLINFEMNFDNQDTSTLPLLVAQPEH